MDVIYIVGGDGFARECYIFLKILPTFDKEIKFGGFLGHDGYGKTVNYKSYQHLYVGEVSEHNFTKNEYVIIGVGYPSLRSRIYNELKERGIKFFNLITPNCFIGDSVSIGEANIIISSSLTANIRVGNGNLFNGLVIVGHDTQVGHFNFFGSRCQLLGDVRLGDNNQIGVNTILLPKAKVGNNNIIAPLSAVYKGCRDNCYMIGNPALKAGNVE